MGIEWSGLFDERLNEPHQLLDRRNWNDRSKERMRALYAEFGPKFDTMAVPNFPPVLTAIYHCNHEAVEFLLNECNADIEGPPRWSVLMPPFLSACQQGDMKMVKLLLEKYRDRFRDLSSSLDRGIKRLESTSLPPWQKSFFLRYLVSLRAELMSKSPRKSGPQCDYHILEQLCRGSYEFRDGESIETIMKELFHRHGYQIHTDFTFYNGRSPLAYASMFGQKEVIRALVTVCAGNVHEIDVNGYSVLREACIGGHFDVVKMLFEDYRCRLDHLIMQPSDRTVDFHRLPCDDTWLPLSPGFRVDEDMFDRTTETPLKEYVRALDEARVERLRKHMERFKKGKAEAKELTSSFGTSTKRVVVLRQSNQKKLA